MAVHKDSTQAFRSSFKGVQVKRLLKLEKVGRDWWVVGKPLPEPCGPYPSRTEAKDIRDGMMRVIDEVIKDDPSFLEKHCG